MTYKVSSETLSIYSLTYRWITRTDRQTDGMTIAIATPLMPAKSSAVYLDAFVGIMGRFHATEEADRLLTDLTVDLQLLVNVYIAAVQRRRQH